MKHPLLETHPAPEHIKREAFALEAHLKELAVNDFPAFGPSLFALCVNALRAYDSTSKDVGLRNRSKQCGMRHHDDSCDCAGTGGGR